MKPLRALWLYLAIVASLALSLPAALIYLGFNAAIAQLIAIATTLVLAPGIVRFYRAALGDRAEPVDSSADAPPA